LFRQRAVEIEGKLVEYWLRILAPGIASYVLAWFSGTLALTPLTIPKLGL